jgi:hypothetical protein
MTVIELLSKERQDYLSMLMNSLLEHRGKYPPAAAEVMIEPNSSKEPPPYRIIRVDIICGGAENPKLIEVNKDRYYSFEPYDLNAAGKVPGKLFPLYWNGIQFRLFGEINSWAAFEKWIQDWMDIDDHRYVKGQELSNVIHNVTVPERIGEYFEFSVDMGSAKIDAFNELLLLFPSMGVNRFEVGSFSMINIEKRRNS